MNTQENDHLLICQVDKVIYIPSKIFFIPVPNTLEMPSVRIQSFARWVVVTENGKWIFN